MLSAAPQLPGTSKAWGLVSGWNESRPGLDGRRRRRWRWWRRPCPFSHSRITISCDISWGGRDPNSPTRFLFFCTLLLVSLSVVCLNLLPVSLLPVSSQGMCLCWGQGWGCFLAGGDQHSVGEWLKRVWGVEERWVPGEEVEEILQPAAYTCLDAQLDWSLLLSFVNQISYQT